MFSSHTYPLQIQLYLRLNYLTFMILFPPLENGNVNSYFTDAVTKIEIMFLPYSWLPNRHILHQHYAPPAFQIQRNKNIKVHSFFSNIVLFTAWALVKIRSLVVKRKLELLIIFFFWKEISLVQFPRQQMETVQRSNLIIKWMSYSRYLLMRGLCGREQK